MKRTLALGIAGALAAGAALFAAPQAAHAQVGVSVGFGNYGWGYSPGLFGVGFGVGSPIGYHDDVGYYGNSYYYGSAPVYYETAPAYRVVSTRIVRQAPRVAVAAPVYYAPRQIVRTRIVTRAPRVVTRRVTTRNVVTATTYGAPEFRSGVRTRIIERSPTRRAFY